MAAIRIHGTFTRVPLSLGTVFILQAVLKALPARYDTQDSQSVSASAPTCACACVRPPMCMCKTILLSVDINKIKVLIFLLVLS